MTFPVYLPVGPLRVHPHVVFEALAYILGFRLFLVLRRNWGDAVSEATRMTVVAGAAVGAALGSKLLFWLQDPALLATSYADPAFLVGGKTIVGGLLGGLAGVEIAKRLSGERRRTGDLFVLPLCLGIAVGRIGCFLTGTADHTSGALTSLPWGVDFGDGPRHPTQLYEIAFLALLAVACVRLRRHLPQPGDLFRVFLAAYLTFRFAIDFLKPEARGYLGLSGIQLACVAGMGWCALRPRHAPEVVHER